MNSLSIHACDPSDWVQTTPLVDAWPFKPLAGLNRWHPASLAELARARVRHAFESSQGAAWIVRRQGREEGFAVVTALPWDSEQIGMSAARLDYLVAGGSYEEQREAKELLLREVCREMREQGVKHLSARIDVSDLSTLHVLEANGFITVDGLINFAGTLPVGDSIPAIPDCRIRLATPADAEPAAQLARRSFTCDRFHADPAIDDRAADELHAAWLRNSCAGRAADAVVIAEDGEGLLGFITCKLQRDTTVFLGEMVGALVLMATAERARRRGLGRALMLTALGWMHGQGAGAYEFGTQLRNVTASRLYLKSGFNLVGSSLSLRKLL